MECSSRENQTREERTRIYPMPGLRLGAKAKQEKKVDVSFSMAVIEIFFPGMALVVFQ